MKILLVSTHVRPDSLTMAAAQAFAQSAIANGHEIEWAKLVEEGFDPVLREPDEPDWDDPDKIYSEEVIREMRRIERNVATVMVFPVWWWSMPAILKGWFDRVWSPKFAFEHGTPIKPLLTGLKSCLVVTTLGSPWWIDRLVMRQPVKRVLKTGLVFACAPQAGFDMLSFHEAETANAGQVDRFVGRMRKAIGRLR